MEFTRALLLSVLAAIASGQTDSSPDGLNIVGGTPVPEGKWPWFVAANFNQGVCGASLIDKNFALTAGHCDGAFRRGVRIGVERITDLDDGIFRDVVCSYRHPGYNDYTLENDIMLLKLSEPVTEIEPVSYQKTGSTNVPAEGTELTVIGFGRTSYGGPSSDVLLQVDVNAISHSACAGQYGASSVYEEAMFCAGAPGKDACQGDSGGPVIASTATSNGLATQVVGITSWGKECALPDYYGVYTRVSTYANWIEGIINSDDSTCPSDSAGNFKQFGRRRLLSSFRSRSLQQKDEAYQSYLNACGDYEYDVSLYVDPKTHLYVVGTPKNVNQDDAGVTGCPFGAAHAIMSETTKATKEILVWDNVEEGASMFEEEGKLHIGTFRLSDMARAYENADPDNSSNNGLFRGFYDVVTNNCGSFLVNLAKELDVKIDSRMTSFVARRLLENSGKELADKVRNNMNFFSLFGSRNLRGNEVTDAEVVERLVEKAVSHDDGIKQKGSAR